MLHGGARRLRLWLLANGTGAQGKDVFGADATDWFEIGGAGGW